LGLSYLRQKRFADALQPFRRIIALNPKHDEARLQLGTALYELGRFQEAKQELEKHIELKPQSAFGHLV
jgi:Flp pilus assembly protein TadD